LLSGFSIYNYVFAENEKKKLYNIVKEQFINPIDLFRYCFVKLIIIVFILLFSCVPPVLINKSGIDSMLETMPDEWKEEPLIILKDTTYLTFVADDKGNKLYQTNKILYYVNDRNFDRFQKIPVNYNVLFESEPEIYCKTVCEDGTTWSITSAKLQSYPSSLDAEYSSNRYVKIISLPQYKKGMLIELVIKRTFIRPEFFSFATFAESFPVLQRNITFQLPLHSQIRYGVFNGQKLDLHDSTWVSSDSFTTVSYSVNNIRGIETLEMFHDASEWISALYFSLPPEGLTSYSWSQLGDHYLSIIRDVYLSSGDDVLLFAKDLRRGLPTDSSMRDILLLLRKKIRYHGNFDGIHAIKPHTLESIVRNGYGDCKDMAVLCQSVAKELNIATSLVLLTAQKGDFQARMEFPTLGAFDHAIVSFQNPDGTTRFADPTSSFGEPLNSALLYEGKRCFLIKPGKSVLDTFPGPVQRTVNVQTDSKVVLDNNEHRWRIEGTITISGVQAIELYPEFRALSYQERPTHLKKFLEKYFELTTESVSFSKLSADTISILYSAFFHENYIPITRGGFQLNKPSIYGGFLRFTTLSFYGLACYNGIIQQDTWTLPAGYTSIDRNNFSTGISNGQWSVRNNIVTRVYKQSRISTSLENANDNTRQKNRFVNATIWK
jgi:hypothetical protein